MANIGLVFFLLAILLSKLEARPIPAAPNLPLSDPNLSPSSIPVTSSSSSSSPKGENLGGDDDDTCKGLNSEDCLMRRSMVAHTDYIYTQDISTSTEP
ncbi:hypothetical protein M0R45_022012 [Rubus argutus]|uniref:Phytosulfokine n=1 Tax=Rubus argutus TaxID=59490 RepID=A0AAW1XD68_RUBAR